MINDDKFKEDGIISMDISKSSEEPVNTLPEDIDKVFKILDFTHIQAEKKTTIVVKTLEQFELERINILKCQYISMAKQDDKFYIICDNRKLYILNLDNIPLSEISILLTFNKPKKIVADIYWHKDIISKDTKGYIDLDFAMKLLFRVKLTDIIKALFANTNASKEDYLYELCVNYIDMAKKINIYLEKNKYNKQFYLENEILIKTIELNKQTIPIDKALFDSYKKKIENEYNEFKSKDDKKLDFKDKKGVLANLEVNYQSLDLDFLKSNNKELYDYYSAYLMYNEIQGHKVINNGLLLKISNMLDYKVKVDVLQNNIYIDKRYSLVGGRFNGLYYRVFCELTGDVSLIKAISDNMFLEHINDILYEDIENNYLHNYTDMILRTYASGIFEPFEMSQHILNNFDTIINVGDISSINYTFEERFSKLISFLKDFNSDDVGYDRYKRIVFNKEVNFDKYIKQIMNAIVKKTLSNMDLSINDYLSKYRKSDDDVFRIAYYSSDEILLLASEGISKYAFETLNNETVNAYKFYIKRAKFFNQTFFIKTSTR